MITTNVRARLTQLLTYCQAMPSFLDCILPFGEQVEKLDSLFCGFRYQFSMGSKDHTSRFAQGGRSGNEYQQTYSLKSVEYVGQDPRWPWYIRRTSVFHSFDLSEGRAVWVILKANKVIMERVSNDVSKEKNSPSNRAAGFASSLRIQAIPCDWAEENWRWYINFLEERLRPIIDRTLNAQVARPPSPPKYPTFSPRSTFVYRSPTQSSSTPYSQKSFVQKVREIVQASDEKSKENMMEAATQVNSVAISPRCTTEFSIDTLRDIQSLEINANEARLILKGNISTLVAMYDNYELIWSSSAVPSDIRAESGRDFQEFQSRLKMTIDSMQMHLQNIENILQRLADGKGLVGLS